MDDVWFDDKVTCCCFGVVDLITFLSLLFKYVVLPLSKLAEMFPLVTSILLLLVMLMLLLLLLLMFSVLILLVVLLSVADA